MTTPALVLIDLQTWITRMPLSPRHGAEVVERCAVLAADARAAGVPVHWVRYLDGTGPGADPEAPRNRIVPDLEVRPDDPVVTKYGLGAFDGTPLAARLRAGGVTDVVLAGIALSHGVGVTAREAAALGFGVTVLEDATSSLSAEGHRQAVQVLKGLVTVTSAASWKPSEVEHTSGP
jgi:nicotinamidase-related amidase